MQKVKKTHQMPRGGQLIPDFFECGNQHIFDCLDGQGELVGNGRRFQPFFAAHAVNTLALQGHLVHDYRY